ncbi:hypothetical protein HDU97_009278 [Phlyctochytrium planicorne]|nr:hypothetical protein HDU97_009278 [Phlyctochytrium planicorne]
MPTVLSIFEVHCGPSAKALANILGIDVVSAQKKINKIYIVQTIEAGSIWLPICQISAEGMQLVRYRPHRQVRPEALQMVVYQPRRDIENLQMVLYRCQTDFVTNVVETAPCELQRTRWSKQLTLKGFFESSQVSAAGVPMERDLKPEDLQVVLFRHAQAPRLITHFETDQLRTPILKPLSLERFFESFFDVPTKVLPTAFKPEDMQIVLYRPSPIVSANVTALSVKKTPQDLDPFLCSVSLERFQQILPNQFFSWTMFFNELKLFKEILVAASSGDVVSVLKPGGPQKLKAAPSGVEPGSDISATSGLDPVNTIVNFEGMAQVTAANNLRDVDEKPVATIDPPSSTDIVPDVSEQILYTVAASFPIQAVVDFAHVGNVAAPAMQNATDIAPAAEATGHDPVAEELLVAMPGENEDSGIKTSALSSSESATASPAYFKAMSVKPTGEKGIFMRKVSIAADFQAKAYERKEANAAKLAMIDAAPVFRTSVAPKAASLPSRTHPVAKQISSNQNLSARPRVVHELPERPPSPRKSASVKATSGRQQQQQRRQHHVPKKLGPTLNFNTKTKTWERAVSSKTTPAPPQFQQQHQPVPVQVTPPPVHHHNQRQPLSYPQYSAQQHQPAYVLSHSPMLPYQSQQVARPPLPYHQQQAVHFPQQQQLQPFGSLTPLDQQQWLPSQWVRPPAGSYFHHPTFVPGDQQAAAHMPRASSNRR